MKAFLRLELNERSGVYQMFFFGGGGGGALMVLYLRNNDHQALWLYRTVVLKRYSSVVYYLQFKKKRTKNKESCSCTFTDMKTNGVKSCVVTEFSNQTFHPY